MTDWIEFFVVVFCLALIIVLSIGLLIGLLSIPFIGLYLLWLIVKYILWPVSRWIYIEIFNPSTWKTRKEQRRKKREEAIKKREEAIKKKSEYENKKRECKPAFDMANEFVNEVRTLKAGEQVDVDQLRTKYAPLFEIVETRRDVRPMVVMEFTACKCNFAVEVLGAFWRLGLVSQSYDLGRRDVVDPLPHGMIALRPEQESVKAQSKKE